MKEHVELLAGFIEPIGVLEKLGEDEGGAEEMGEELPQHVPFQGDPAIQHVEIEPPSEEKMN